MDFLGFNVRRFHDLMPTRKKLGVIWRWFELVARPCKLYPADADIRNESVLPFSSLTGSSAKPELLTPNLLDF